MAILARLQYPHVDSESYDLMIPQVGQALRNAPGFIAHLATQTPDGFDVIEVWASQEALDTFIRETIAPTMEGAGGTAPVPETHTLYHTIVAG